MGQARQDHISHLRRYIERHWSIAGDSHSERMERAAKQSPNPFFNLSDKSGSELWAAEHVLDGLEQLEFGGCPKIALRTHAIARETKGRVGYWNAIVSDAATILQNSLEDLISRSSR